MDLLEQIEIAFKKLKGSMYFDKTQLVFRQKLVEFENAYDFNDKIINLAKALQEKDSNWEKYEQYLLNSVSYLAFPKTIKSKYDENKIIYNENSKTYYVDKIQYMFDCNVEVQLIGILWMLTVGISIDSSLSECVFGNRIRKSILTEKNNLTYSPYLLKPYFEQYQTWRDNGLKIAETYIDKKTDVLIITMDLMSFYYSVDFENSFFEKFYYEYKDNNQSTLTIDDNIVKRINTFIYKIICRYSEKLPTTVCTGNCLPIGFLPSNILSNCYLNKFDSAIYSKWNPLYYGRYVDDIIIVDKVEKKTYIHSKLMEGTLTHSDVIESYFCNCKAKPEIRCQEGNGLLILDKETLTHDEKNKTYYINPNVMEQYTDNKKNPSRVTVQNSKVKTFYFKAGGSKALLTAFRDAINKNRSEFRFMPGEDEYLKFSDYSSIFELIKESNSSVNKFGDIKDATINKFNLSKFIGKMTKISLLVDDKRENNFEEDILKIFSNDKIIENYILIEIILQQLITNENFDLASQLLDNICNAIKNLQVNDNFNNNILKVKESLIYHVTSSITRATALVWRKEIKTLLDNFIANIIKIDVNSDYNPIDYHEFVEYRNAYITTRMVNKYSIPAMVDNIINTKTKFTDKEKLNLTKFEHYCKLVRSSDACYFKHKPYDIKTVYYRLYPYCIKLQDIEMTKYIDNIYRLGKSKFHFLSSSKKAYVALNYPNILECNIDKFFEFIREKSINNVNNGIKSYVTTADIKHLDTGKCKIAIANTILEYDEMLPEILTNHPNRKMDRYNRLKKIIDDAIKIKANMLVLPECYTPFEWLPLLAQKAVQNKLAIVTGVEHIIHKVSNTEEEIATNLTATILPFSLDEDNVSCHINLRNKVHYSHEEKCQLKGYRYTYKEGEFYDLFSYNDFWFSVYCCFELASLKDRSLFGDVVDGIIAVEYNRDTKYFSNIMESLSRDLHCYCVQVNTSNYGDSRIIAPTGSVKKDLVQVKGGLNDVVLLSEINIKSLREFQFKEYELQKNDNQFKPTPPDFDTEMVNYKIKRKMFEKLTNSKEDL